MHMKSTTLTLLILALAGTTLLWQPVYASKQPPKEDEKSKEKSKPGFLPSFKMPTFGKSGKKGNQEQAGLASKPSEAHGPGGGGGSSSKSHRSGGSHATVVPLLLDQLPPDLSKGLQGYLTFGDLKVMYETPTSDITSPTLKTIMAMNRPKILRAIYDVLDVTSFIDQRVVFTKLEGLLQFNGYDGEKKFFVLDKDTPWNVLGKVADAYMDWLSNQDKPKNSLHKLFSFAASIAARIMFQIVGVSSVSSYIFKFQEKLELVIKEYQANEDPAAFVYQGRKWDQVVKGRTYTGIPTLGITNRPMPTTPLGENDIPLTDEPWELGTENNIRMVVPFLLRMLGPNDEKGDPTMHYSVVLSKNWTAEYMKGVIKYVQLDFKQRKSLKSYFRALAQERGFTVNFD